MIAKNETIAKLCVMLGFHKYIIYYDQVEESITKKDVDDYLNFSFVSPDFDLNEQFIEPFEPPKILGDVFESVMGAVFEDGGIDQVVNVYKHVLSPFILYVAKFSKAAYKEPKE